MLDFGILSKVYCASILCISGTNRIFKLVVQDDSERSRWFFDLRWAAEACPAIRVAAFDTSAQPSQLHCSVDWVWKLFLLHSG